jgi:hypothetical protein
MSDLFGRLLAACTRCGHTGFSHENDSECVECGCSRWSDVPRIKEGDPAARLPMFDVKTLLTTNDEEAE